MYKRILVPMDGSPLAEQVLPYVRLLAKSLAAPIELMRVINPVPQELSDPVHGLYTDQVSASFKNSAEESLSGYVDSLKDMDVEVSSFAQEGEPAAGIVDEASRSPDTLIAMATHGRSGIGRWVLGSVTDKVLHATTNPLFIVRGRSGGSTSGYAKIDNIIVPQDGSAVAEQILPHAISLSRALGVKIIAFTIIPSEQSHAHEEDHLRQLGERLLSEGAHSFEARVLHADPAKAIVDMTHEMPDSLVAMTTHGHSGVGHWVLGSVTDRVVRYSGSPVLVIRAE